MDLSQFGKVKAYEEIVDRIQKQAYKGNANTYKKNREHLHGKVKWFTRKLEKGNSKQEQSNAVKLEKAKYLLAYMESLNTSGSPKAKTPEQIVVVHPKSKSPNVPVPVKLPTPSPSPKPAASPNPKSPNPELKAIVANLQADFYKTMAALKKEELESLLKYLSDIYYNDGISLFTDEQYDRLRDTLLKKFGESEVLVAIGAEVKKQKIKLPYFMGSMDKIKPDKNNLSSWLLKYPGKVCISDKLDGISALVVKEGGKKALYTRGDGTTGQDITHMLAHIQIGDFPELDHYAVRGELIVNKANYDAVKEGKRGARQMVAGLANQKKLTKETISLMNKIEFVAYEVIVPELLTPSQQFQALNTQSNFHTANWQLENTIDIGSLSEILTQRKKVSKYEIDGIIIAHDKYYPRKPGNPEHAFAFKMAFADQQADTEVLAVLWEASKDGYLKPTVQFEPVNIGDVIIQYATGFNAAFIQSQGIGPGAFIEIIRSGDVIPYIKEVKSASPTGPQMPTQAWHWNETHVDAVLDNLGDSPDVQKRILLYFANTLEIGFCGEGNIQKLYDAGIKTIKEMVYVTKEQLVKSGQFAAKSAEKLETEIKVAMQKATLTQWAVGSGIFGRGIGTKRTQQALELLPRSLDAPADLEARVAALSGWSKESARGFVENLPEFKRFMESMPVKAKTPVKVASPQAGKFLGQTFLFTGFHPKDLEAAVAANGGIVADSFGSKVTMVVIKDSTVSNEKTKKAEKLGIKVVTGDELRAML